MRTCRDPKLFGKVFENVREQFSSPHLILGHSVSSPVKVHSNHREDGGIGCTGLCVRKSASSVMALASQLGVCDGIYKVKVILSSNAAAICWNSKLDDEEEESGGAFVLTRIKQEYLRPFRGMSGV
ncbi:hypothetical protein Tco_1226025 [Tanacetum coccineum]